MRCRSDDSWHLEVVRKVTTATAKIYPAQQNGRDIPSVNTITLFFSPTSMFPMASCQVGAWLPALHMFQQMPMWRLVATETTYSAVISVAWWAPQCILLFLAKTIFPSKKRWVCIFLGAGCDIREEVTTSQKVVCYGLPYLSQSLIKFESHLGAGFQPAGSSLKSGGKSTWILSVCRLAGCGKNDDFDD